MITSLLVATTLMLGQASPGTPPISGAAPARLASFGMPSLAEPTVSAAPDPYMIRTSLAQEGPGTGASSGRGSGFGNEWGAGDAEASKNGNEKKTEPIVGGPLRNFLKAYWDEFFPKKDDKNGDKEEPPPAPRRGPPSPFIAPPFPTGDWQGYPNIGDPPTDFSGYPIMKGLYATPWGDAIKESRIYLYGWVTGSANYSSSRESNVPSAYAVVPNRAELDQAVLRLEREPDDAQTDHWDWGFRLTGFYGIDYRYTTAGGYGSEQLLKHNRLYGLDPLEIYSEVYIPGIFDGMNIRVGRYISPPDIEAQLAPDNYLASHSILFAYDNYTQTGILGTVKLSDQWMVQAGVNAGGDMAPWYQGATPTGFLGVRWISASNTDSIYTCMNDLNNAHYRQFSVDGVPTGHDNYNYLVSTWSHKFNDKFITTTEAYYMYQYNAPLGGTPSTGPVQSFGGGGGEGPILPGLSQTYGVLNYTAFQISKQDYITVRNEAYNDPRGARTGFPTWYSSHTVGLSHNFNAYLQMRPEIGYYRSYNTPAFDNGTRSNQLMFLCDFTIRF